MLKLDMVHYSESTLPKPQELNEQNNLHILSFPFVDFFHFFHGEIFLLKGTMSNY